MLYSGNYQLKTVFRVYSVSPSTLEKLDVKIKKNRKLKREKNSTRSQAYQEKEGKEKPGNC